LQLEGMSFYQPKQIGKEKLFAERLEQLKSIRNQKLGKNEPAEETKKNDVKADAES